MGVASGAAVQVSSNPQTHEESISGIGMETAFPIAPDTVATLLALRNLSSRVLEGQSALHDRIGRLEERLEQLTLPGRSDRCTKRHSDSAASLGVGGITAAARGPTVSADFVRASTSIRFGTLRRRKLCFHAQRTRLFERLGDTKLPR